METIKNTNLTDKIELTDFNAETDEFHTKINELIDRLLNKE